MWYGYATVGCIPWMWRNSIVYNGKCRYDLVWIYYRYIQQGQQKSCWNKLLVLKINNWENRKRVRSLFPLENVWCIDLLSPRPWLWGMLLFICTCRAPWGSSSHTTDRAGFKLCTLITHFVKYLLRNQFLLLDKTVGIDDLCQISVLTARMLRTTFVCGGIWQIEGPDALMSLFAATLAVHVHHITATWCGHMECSQ